MTVFLKARIDMQEDVRLIEAIIGEMGPLFHKGVFAGRSTFRFTLEGTSITVSIDADGYEVERDSALATVDCSCKTTSEMFRKIWYDGYRPGIMDFLAGEVRCDAPLMLPQFLRAFGKI